VDVDFHPERPVKRLLVPCEECGVELVADSPALRLELTCDDKLIVYCAPCWQRELDESEASAI
jgi:hypothetical protein